MYRILWEIFLKNGILKSKGGVFMEKRIITLILALGLMFGSVLTGCSANTENSSPDRSSQPTEQEQTSVSGEPV